MYKIDITIIHQAKKKDLIFMIFQDIPFSKFTIWSAIESGLYYIIAGYYILIFFYFILMRFRTSKKFYWFFFALLFLFLAVGRVFFIIYDFYTPELEGLMTDAELISLLMIQYRMATFFTWMAISSLMGVFGILIFPPVTEGDITPKESEFKKKVTTFFRVRYVRIILRICLISIPVIVAICALTLPDELFMDPKLLTEYDGVSNPPPHPVQPNDLVLIFGYPAGRFVLNFILLPLMVLFIPFMFIYLAMKTYGVLRRSYGLNAIGFFLYFLGRILQGLFDSFGWVHYRAVMPPLLILLSLLIIVIANNYEQLR